MAKTLIMGVMNITPDSFYDGGRVGTPGSARARAEQMVLDGADWLDVGGESSRPGAAVVSGQEELRRLLPVLEVLPGVGAPISVDTYRANTARRALALGVSMINDISAFRMDPGMAEVVAESGCACVLMHMQGTPQNMQIAPRYGDVIGEIRAFFEERLGVADRAGIAREKIWLDPGFGFGKTVGHNLTLLRRLAEFKDFGLPVLIGTSNKSTIGAVLDVPVSERLEGTAATVSVSIVHGVDMVRVHEVKAMARVARMTDAIIRGGFGEDA